MLYSLIELGGDATKPVLALSPATGFVPETYLPMLQTFMDDYRVLSVPPRALWEGTEPQEDASGYSWQALADDMVATLEQHNLQDVIMLGHSMGGIVTMLAALQRPDLFRAIIMLDPVVLPQQITNWMKQAIAKGESPNPQMEQGALKRRNEFESVDEAFENFHGKSIFADWPDEVLRLYCEHGLVDRGDGILHLRWSPEWEAFYFRTYFADIWEHIGKVSTLTIPVLFVRGGESDTLQPGVFQRLQGMLPNADFKEVAGQGHLFAQSAPDASATVISEWLDEVL